MFTGLFRGGYALSGYCLAALNAFDMSADEKEVDVFQVVLEIIKSRDQFDFSLVSIRFGNTRLLSMALPRVEWGAGPLFWLGPAVGFARNC